MSASKDRKVVIHGHMFKNAGTTIDWLLNRNFGENFHEDRNDELVRKKTDYLNDFLKKHQNIKAFSSHSLRMPLTQHGGVKLLPLVMLRNPLYRVRSVYVFERGQKANTLGAKAAKSMTFCEYVDWRLDHDVPGTIRNFQVNYLSSKPNAEKTLKPLERLSCAMKFVEENMLAGVVEYFDDSMKLFRAFLSNEGIEFDISYQAQNVSKKKNMEHRENAALVEELGESRYNRLLDENGLDICLYAFAKQQLKQRMSMLTN